MTAIASSAADVLLALDEPGGSDRPSSRPVPSGLDALDLHLGGGFAAGDLAVLAGAQGIGKTTMGLQLARNVAASGRPATYVCFEHTVEQLLERLLVMEANLAARDAAPSLAEVRSRLARPASTGLSARLGDLPGIPAALAALTGYGSRLRLVQARGDVTTLADIDGWAREHEVPGVVVVDYLQKVHVDDRHESGRVARIANSLKDIALETGQVVLAVSALDKDGLVAPRVRARHLQGSIALAYEADVILVVQRKWDVVAREKLVFNLSAAQQLHDWVVVSIEKNRHGEDRIDLAFRKRLSRGYFDPSGRVEEDVLVDERVHMDR